jgi:hypothetical protein
MAKKEISSVYQVAPSLCLYIENLWAEVSISAGEENTANVMMSGDEESLKDIKVSQPNPGLLQIEGAGPNGQGSGITVIATGGRGRQSVSISSVRGGNIVVSGGTIKVDGKVVSEGGGVKVFDGCDIPKIEVTVPRGTDLEIYGVEKAEVSGLNGKLSSRVGGQSSLKAADVRGLKVKCSGQSSCEITRASGDAKLTAAGQSVIIIQGNLDDVEADAGGQSHITINGNCHDFEGDASGQSRILLSGKASGKVRQRESGQSRVMFH